LIEGLLCQSRWAYDFLNVPRFFAGFGADEACPSRLDGCLYVLPRGVRDLVDGINGPGRNPDITQARRPDLVSAGFLLCTTS
jgi:hypothetical protein